MNAPFQPATPRNRKHLIGLIILSVFLAFLVHYLIYGKSGIKAHRSLAARMEAMEVDIERLKRENDALRKEIIYRQSNEYMEELVRTELRRIMPGEILVIFPTPVTNPGSDDLSRID